MKKILHILLIPGLLFPFSVAHSSHLSYAHGFNEKNKAKSAFFYYEKFDEPEGGYSLIVFPDDAGDINNAVFYTQPAVESVINDLHHYVCIEKNDSIIVVGYSCGGGTLINSLAKLVEYTEYDNEDPFDGTNIESAEQARAIVDAINNGAIILNAPLLDIKKIKKIIDRSYYLEIGTIIAASAAACCCGISIGYVGIIGFAAHCALGNYIQKLYAAAITDFYVPRRTHYHFDPTYPTPLESVNRLQGRFSCPILLHFNAHDGVLADPDEDTVKLYNLLKNEKTHIIITNDANHDKGSKQFGRALTLFNNHYFVREQALIDNAWIEWCKNTQPTTNAIIVGR